MNQRKPVIPRAIAIMKRSFGSLYLAASWPYVLAFVVLAIFSFVLRSYASSQPRQDPVELWHSMGAFGKLGVLAAFVATTWLPIGLSYGSVAFSVYQVHSEHPIELKAVVNRAARRFIPIAILSICIGFCVILGYAFFVVPGILIQAFSAFSIPVTVLEGEGVVASIARSISIAGHRFWITLVVFITIGMIALALELAALIFLPLMFPEDLPGLPTTPASPNMVLLAVGFFMLTVLPLVVEVVGTILGVIYIDGRLELSHPQSTASLSIAR